MKKAIKKVAAKVAVAAVIMMIQAIEKRVIK